ncbi:MAG TPA: hypothetical protein DDZ53_13180 [Firmicutes bacterium]|jgi:hypothetical protein|nr:hypothetical protein [Bacillota bacterium]
MRRISIQLAIAFTAVALIAGLWMGHGYAAGSAAAPGSDLDPLVTKSYVDDAITQLSDGIDDVVVQLTNKIDTMGKTEPGDATEASILHVVSVPPGGRLIAYEGTEFILRSGNAVAIGSAAGGIPDLTAGRDLANNTAIPANHLLLFPRSDQRGVKASTAIIVMVRGKYSIEP